MSTRSRTTARSSSTTGALLGDEALARKPDFQALIPLHDEMIAAYREGDVDRSRRLLDACERHPLATGLATVYTIYGERLNHFRERPPQSDWDGVYDTVAAVSDLADATALSRI